MASRAIRIDEFFGHDGGLPDHGASSELSWCAALGANNFVDFFVFHAGTVHLHPPTLSGPGHFAAHN